MEAGTGWDMKKLIILLLAMPLAGCVTAMSAEQQAALQAAASRCGVENKSMFGRAQCLNNLERRTFGSNALLETKYAARLRLAVAVDEGRMSGPAAEAEFAAIIAQLQVQVGQMEAQQRAATSAALMQASAALIAAGQPQQPPAAPVTCVRVVPTMVTVTCN
jgi:hypothetical protein